MDPEVEGLVAQERLVEAARLASARGDAARASALFERACDWSAAAAEALRAGEPARSLTLAARGADDAAAERAALALAKDAPSAVSAAVALASEGHHRWAATLWEASGHTAEAAEAWERAGEATRAARLFEAIDGPARAAEALEAALRRDPRAYGAAAALGALLARYGKDEAAVRALQRVPIGAPERREALAFAVTALARLGLTSAAAEATRELEALGGAAPATASAAPPPTPQRALLFGRYEVVREAANSPTARVLECVDVVSRARVAVKVLAAQEALGTGRDAVARFAREIEVLRALDHPSVVPLHEFFPDGPAVVLRWMEGGSLEGLLADGPIAPARAHEIAAAVLRALGDAHRLGILHRDVKPANVLIDAAGAARLSDFGVASFGDLATTATAGVFGTRGYMSPEQREGRPATPRSDIYSVGVLLREMLTGERPSADRTPTTTPSDAHRGLDARHDAAIARLTAVDPSQRPSGAPEALAILGALPWPSEPAGPRIAESACSSEARVRTTHPTDTPTGPAREDLVATNRLRTTDEGTTVDVWTGGAIVRLPPTRGVLERARRFAQADHPALQVVLRVDPEDGAIWLDAPRGRPMHRPLTAEQRRELGDALRALHAAGSAHGQLDGAHVFVDDEGGVTLAFPTDSVDGATAQGDLEDLARLV
ncbi:MAG TPA: serine/threonine-protein kinase [Polyangiaceae bacterium]|nr:serine/threonine-protein kinase [Polyangiaceae bacterium]